MSSSYRHLTRDDRKTIEIRLNDGKSFADIAAEIGVSPTTVGREVKRNGHCEPTNQNKTVERNDCVHLRTCERRHLCSEICRRFCRNCAYRDCRDMCELYAKRTCDIREKAPYVCNACPSQRTCSLPRWFYRGRVAGAAAGERACASRAGIDITEERAAYLVETVRAGLAKGQSIHHIFATRDMPCSERTFYRYVAEGRIDMIPLELSRSVKYKKRRRAKKRTDPAPVEGRTFSEFSALSEEERACCCEGDTVWGAKGEDASLLSLHRADLHCQIFLKLEKRTCAHVVSALDWLEALCGSPETFSGLFDPMLVDRGSEFFDPEGMERSSIDPDARRCRVFYTDAQRPDQKGACEKNHVELRKVLPKGTPLEPISQWQLAEITSHVNSTVRRGCGNATPMALMKMVFPQKVIEGLGLRLVAPREVVCVPNVLYDPKDPKVGMPEEALR